MTLTIDKDLLSVQEARNLLRTATEAQRELAALSQERIDTICLAIKDAALAHARELGEQAHKETGYGRAEDKLLKNYFAAQTVYDSIKELKTVGIVRVHAEQRLFEVAVPVGVIVALIPSTNPTSTVIYKALVSIKAGNAVVFSPHPGAQNCIFETVEVVRRAAEAAGMPPGAIGVLKTLTKEGTAALLSSPYTKLILATGGEAMVKAAYSSGNPAIGVGPGNGPAYIEKSADIALAVRRIIDSKTFDNGVICASEQSIIVEREIEARATDELTKQGCYFLTPVEKEALDAIMLTPGGTTNPALVGKTAVQIAQMAGIPVARDTKILIGREAQIGKKIPFSREKLYPVLAFYVVGSWQEACALAIRILTNEGAGHTMIMHSENEELIREFALEKPVSRLLINTGGALGGIGASTLLPPSLTLGCGAVGGSSTSDNITPLNLINIRRIAYGVRELAELRSVAEQTGQAEQDLQASSAAKGAGRRSASGASGGAASTAAPASAAGGGDGGDGASDDAIDALVHRLYAQLKEQGLV